MFSECCVRLISFYKWKQRGIQWNPSIADTIGNQLFVPYNEAVEHNVVSFSELSLAVCRQGSPAAKATITSNSASLVSSC